MKTMMYLQKESISPELLCNIVPFLTIDKLEECVENSKKYKEIKDYRDLHIEVRNTLYGELQKSQIIRKETTQRRYIYHNYEEWFDENHGIHYSCAFIIIKYICKNYKCGVFESEIKQLKKKTKDISTFYNFLREQKINAVLVLLSKEMCIDCERLKSIFNTLKIEE